MGAYSPSRDEEMARVYRKNKPATGMIYQDPSAYASAPPELTRHTMAVPPTNFVGQQRTLTPDQMRSNDYYRAVTGREMAIPGAVLFDTSPNGTAKYGELHPPTTYTLPAPAQAPGPAQALAAAATATPTSAPIDATKVGPVKPAGIDSADIARRMAVIQDDLIRAKYLGRSVGGNGPAVTPEQNATAVMNINDLRRERDALDRSNQPNPTPLTPQANASNARGLDMRMIDELMKARRTTDEGSPEYGKYSTSIDAAQQRTQGTPAAQMAGFFAGGMSPEVGRAYGQAQAGMQYGQKGAAATQGQEKAAARSEDYRLAAAADYDRWRNARMERERFDTQVGSQGRELALAQGGAAVSEANARKTEADFRTNPDYMKAIQQARITGAQTSAEKGQLDLDKTRADMDLQRRDIAGSKYLDEKAEKLYADTFPDLNTLTDKGEIDASTMPAISKVASNMHAFQARIKLLPPEAQDHYRQQILTEFGNPSPEEYDRVVAGDAGLLQTLRSYLPWHGGEREAFGRLQGILRQLKPFLYQRG